MNKVSSPETTHRSHKAMGGQAASDSWAPHQPHHHTLCMRLAPYVLPHCRQTQGTQQPDNTFPQTIRSFASVGSSQPCREAPHI